MQSADVIVITAVDIEVLEDLQNWLKSEYEIISDEKYFGVQPAHLGGGTSGIGVIVSFIQSSFEKFVSILKNWATNYNKDIELSLEHGDKRVTIKCPANRVTDDQIDKVFSTLIDFCN